MYATPASLNKIIENIALKDNVANFHWTKHLVESHSDSIKENLQCQSLAVQEGWHYSVFNEDNTCYFGTMNAENSFIIGAQSSLSIIAQKYLRECEDTYFILQNKYLCIYEDSFGVKILRDD